MVDTKIPPLTVDLIDYLDMVFPNRCPDINDTDREVWFKAGQHYVVNYLKNWTKGNDDIEQLLP